jgi:hypothetical protein
MDASCLDHAFDSNTPKLDIHENLIRTIEFQRIEGFCILIDIKIIGLQ